MIRLPDPERSRALLFGTATYASDELPDLPAVVDNLEDLRGALTSPLGSFAAEHCHVLLDPPGLIPLFDALDHQAAEARDTLLIYFAGHALRKTLGGGLHLALPHTRSANQAVSGFDYDRLREIVTSSPATNKIVIVDGCFSGRADQGVSGIAQELAIEGCCLLTSADAGRQALGPSGTRNTTFTGALLGLLRHGVPAAGPLLSVGALGDELRRGARRQGTPLPGQQFHGTAMHIALARNPAAPATGVAPPPPAPPTPPLPPPPPPPLMAEHAYVSRALVLAGTAHVTRQDLAQTIRGNWQTAADLFFRDMGTTSHPSEGWTELRSWLRQFNDPRTDDVEGRIILVDRRLNDPALPHDHKLLHLLRWLDPDGPVVYRGRPVTYRALARVCLRPYVGGDSGDSDDEELLEELSGPHQLLDALSGFATLNRLEGVRRAWEQALAAWRATETASWPAEVRNWAAEVGPGALLAALLPPEDLAEVRPPLPTEGPPVPSTGWYDRLLVAAGGRETLLGRLAEVEWSDRARQEGRAWAGREEQRLRAEEEQRARREEAARREQERRFRKRREHEERRLAEEPRLREERRLAEEERQRRARRAQEEEQERQRRLREWRAAEAVRLRPAARAGAVLRAFALGAVWAFFPVVAVWLSWWFSSYEFDAAQVLSWLVCVVSAAALYRLVPCAYRLGAAFRPRPLAPATWLPPARTALGTGAVLLVYGLIGGDSSSRASRIKADSDLLREVGLGKFLTYVGQNGTRDSFGDMLVGLLALAAAAGCVWIGLQAGRITARRWEEKFARAQEEAHGPARHE
ncbi:caspase, EACC1-associated type [Streptomyces caeruleatus]|uniref:Caspase family p20 domain-containing protein n=1 Tax=Streptomyces caeruleatus TaxID=661399 RepID=A0A117RLM7_9ACTN|nr:caspase family protein [Streptomyces caeruleatus]KUN97575.1 hypothetical protein AQJ67_29610 [Streptomyces caeruleatus]